MPTLRIVVEPQARPFYEKLDYEVFAMLEDCPPGHREFFLRKLLAENHESPSQ
jgi:hypothetical protein